MLRIIYFLLRLILASILVYWGFLKLYPVEPFEYRLVEQCLMNWYFAPLLARLAIGLIWAISAFLIFKKGIYDYIDKDYMPAKRLSTAVQKILNDEGITHHRWRFQ